MDINKLKWLSEKIDMEAKEEFDYFLDEFDEEVISFVIDKCYEKNPLYPSRLFLILKNAIEKSMKMKENCASCASFDSYLFEKALDSFTYPYTFDKYMTLEALCNIINTNPNYFNDTAFNAIINKTAFSSNILLKLSLEVKTSIICTNDFTSEEKSEMLSKLCNIDKKELAPPLIMEPFREYYDIRELLRQDYSKFSFLENKLKKALFDYIIDDYDNAKTLLLDHSNYKKLSHFKDAFNEKNIVLLYAVLDSKNINSFLISVEMIRLHKTLNNEELRHLIEKINFVVDQDKICKLETLVKSNDFYQINFDEKLKQLDYFINTSDKVKVKKIDK